MTRGDIESASSSLRGTQRGVQVRLPSPSYLPRQLCSQITLFQILNNIVRAGLKPREAVLAYFGNVAKANAKRAAMRVEPGTMSTHG